jgi:carbamoyl-phosphate synthase large subunit
MKSTQKAILALEDGAVFEVGEGRPDIVDQIKNGEINLVINTPSGKKPKADEVAIRSQSVAHNIPCITTLSGAEAVVNAIESLKRGMSVKSIQEYHQRILSSSPTLQKTVTAYPTVP